MKISRIVSMLVLASAPAFAATITSSFGDFSSATDNDNQAGPFRGVSYTLLTTGTYTNPSITQGSSGGANSYTATHSLTNPDALATTVDLVSLTWQTSSSTSNAGIKYVAVFDSVTTDINGNVTGLGTYRGVSTNSVGVAGTWATGTRNTTVTFNFSGINGLTAGGNYAFAVVGNNSGTYGFADIGGINLEMKGTNVNPVTNLLQENVAIAGNATGYNNRLNWEPVFQLQYIPEPSAALLGGLGMLALLRRRRGV